MDEVRKEDLEKIKQYALNIIKKIVADTHRYGSVEFAAGIAYSDIQHMFEKELEE